MAKIKADDGSKLKISNKDKNFKKALRKAGIKVGDVVDAEVGEFEVKAVWDGSDVDMFYEERLRENPNPVLYRRSLKQLSEQFGTDATKGGVLIKKKMSNVFVFVPLDDSKDK